MFAEYISERDNAHLVQNNKGFVTYKFLKNQICYIENIYVRSGFRRLNVGTEFADIVSEIAKNSGCKRLMGTVMPSSNGAHESMLSLLSYGFRLMRAEEDAIYFEKEL